MANLNLIDPNEVVLGSNHPFKGTGLGIPDFEEIRSFVELTMRPRNTNYIEIQNDNIVGNSTVDSGERISLTGYYTRGGTNYYSTNYTEDGRPEYEGFGMQDIAVKFDANKIPEVSITFYDFRGNVLNNFNSKFAKMFQLPYPVFELRIKGGLGPSIKYRLRKIRDDISIDDTGNFIIKSKFIGDRFAPLSDVPLNYLQAVPYLGKGSVTIDTIITSFHELIIRAKRMYEKFNAEVNSDQEIQTQDDIKKLEDKRNSLQDIYNELNDKAKFENWFSDNTLFKGFNSTKQTNIKNYVALTEIKNDIILLKENPKPPLSAVYTLTVDEEDFISDTITEKKVYYDGIITKNGYSNLLTDNKVVISTVILGSVSTEISRTTKLDFTQLKAKIDELNNQIIAKSVTANSLLQDRLGKIVKENLGGSRLTIGDIFKFMFQDYNILMSKVKTAGDKGFADNARYSKNQTYDKIGWPTVVDIDTTNGAKKLIYPGVKKEFQSWPEVKFVEEFIESFTKAQVANMQAELEASKNEDGTSRYIPINPREIYKLTNDNPPVENKISDAVNIYSNKTVEQICDLIYERYLIFYNFSLNITESVDTISNDWRFSSTAGTFDWVRSIFKKDVDFQRKVFLSTIEAEARNIAFALLIAEDKVKDYFIQLNKDFNDETYFTSKPNEPLSKSRDVVNGFDTEYGSFKTLSYYMKIGDAFSPTDKNYVTVSKAPPRNVTDGTPQQGLIYDYMKTIHELNGQYKITKDNLLYLPDSKANSYESDYDNSGRTPKLTPQISFNTVNTIIQYLNVTTPQSYDIFDFEKLFNNSAFPALLQIPQGMLIIMGGILQSKLNTNPTPTSDDYIIDIQGNSFRVVKNSNFYNYLLELWADARDNEATRGFAFSVSALGGATSNLVVRLTTSSKAVQTTATEADRQAVLNFLYEPIYLSINSTEFYNTVETRNYYLSLDKTAGNWKVFARWCKELLIKLSGFLEADKKTLEDKLRNYNNQMRDNDVKLSMYKSFQVIYENYLYGYDDSEFKLETKKNFKFVDRAYNDISDKCVLDIKTLLSDTNDSNVNMFTSISRLLSDNNFWFYPFQGFLTTSANYRDLFKIDYQQRLKTEPMFVAMYVGGVSSNPNTPNPNSAVANDGILKNEKLPDDFGKTTAGSLDAFIVKYTGIQNQIVFSNFDHSTESLKNTDEGLRIQSEVISTASNSLAVPKGQSLLNVYQKQSYVSTIKIPLGNMGIQPTQYFYLEFIPIFEGLYIIYNVEHSINASTQRLETTFKAYRLKKDVNPIVETEIIDFTKSNYYAGAASRAGGTVTLAEGKTAYPELPFITPPPPPNRMPSVYAANKLKSITDIETAKACFIIICAEARQYGNVVRNASSAGFSSAGGHNYAGVQTDNARWGAPGIAARYRRIDSGGNNREFAAFKTDEDFLAFMASRVKSKGFVGSDGDKWVERYLNSWVYLNLQKQDPAKYNTMYPSKKNIYNTYAPIFDRITTGADAAAYASGSVSPSPPTDYGSGSSTAIAGSSGSASAGAVAISTTATILTIGDSISYNLNNYNNKIQKITTPIALTKPGEASQWLIDQLKQVKNPLTSVKQLVVSMGANDVFNLTSKQTNLIAEIKRVFPSATQKFILNGHYGWGGLSVDNTKGKTDAFWDSRINNYIGFFQSNGFIVVGDKLGPIGHPGNKKGDKFLDAVADDLKSYGIS